ncbi:acetolactate decarboxylase [Chitinophaga filiformis]|uniref:acetolactate decarboxylase n=1 Tax=Chitinophaga filiformis TaxID=104663 RepID=UPI001F276734|nr:acetolactate decarboxylase [Chitinophaga filiformis]MCF6407171.1 acetolactate decarboxylase [Chitinophaga filiformis]
MTQAFNYSRTGSLLMLMLLGTLSSLQAQKQTSDVSSNTTTVKKYPGHKRATVHNVQYNTLFQYGVADAFIGGVFDGNYTWSQLKQQGDFGLGAPDKLDGELTICDGKGYQTQSTGKTIQVTDSFKTSLAFVTFFKADTTFVVSGTQDQAAAFNQIDTYLEKKNGMYAIRISGSFNQLKTRAFPPPPQPYAPLATLLNTQQFFDIKKTKGVLIGYKLPTYINGLSIEGYHFHFLSDDRTQGGHMLSFSGNDLKVEVAELKDFHMTVPDDSSFMNYEFKKKQNIDLEKVEKGH